MAISRRNLLKLTGSVSAALAALPLTNLSHLFANTFEADLGTDPEPAAPPTPLGRVADWAVQVRAEPNRKSELIRSAKRDELLGLIEQVEGEAVLPHNKIWYKVDGGYAYSSFVQPVLEKKNTPEPEKAKDKFWGEITMPFADGLRAPDPKSGRMARLYFTSVYRVVDAKQGEDGQWWYQLQDGVTFGVPGPYIPATHMRRFDPSELTPISPELTPDHKRIEVDLTKQMVLAYEDDKLVMTSRTATGYGSFQTPKGTHRIIRKRISSRMIGGEGSDRYDLPGVPFPSYFTVSAVATHGAYWHNDFGRRRSHGCVNTTAEVARWIWRWTLPEMRYDEVEIRTRDVTATKVVVY
jgi:hypothetical protein